MKMPEENGEDINESSRRIFTRLMKDECWKKSREIPGRDPERWRYDAVGNPVVYRLRGCEGCLCHEYDHIIPFSKGGLTEVSNCQILQTRANRYKGNEPNDANRLLGYSCARTFTQEEMDLMEIGLYGNVKRVGRECRVFSIFEIFDGFGHDRKPPARQRPFPNCPGGMEKPPNLPK